MFGAGRGAPIASAKSASEMCSRKGATCTALTANFGLGIAKAGVLIRPLRVITAPNPRNVGRVDVVGAIIADQRVR